MENSPASISRRLSSENDDDDDGRVTSREPRNCIYMVDGTPKAAFRMNWPQNIAAKKRELFATSFVIVSTQTLTEQFIKNFWYLLSDWFN
ncbi:hypothetical protein CEXT_541301 [Caerostris extrusa]|uniref:Uncharacterized protein n=1 Tax=Caerostris extrusa TaxID=172846 RepID=A0AAV4XDN8_CAEEX|nr:hypothetical protein CEXT_541301 [Caerostris extrusa]